MSTTSSKSDYSIVLEGFSFPVHRVHTLVIGSGAAALKAADRLHQNGVSDIAIVTESIMGGTSFNTGSDKQTYYRLSTATKEPDSPYLMAQDLFKGGSMHGDLALVEAIGSTEAFHHLTTIGVPFPSHGYGGYIGYKTDHDSRERGSSIGPYTSKKMVEVLLAEVQRRNIPLYDHMEVVSLIHKDQRVMGALAIDRKKLLEQGYGLTFFMAENVIFGTGGPGGIYQDSVYPACHSGAVGLALEIGAEASNLQESQFGMASTKFRWNVSGSYQQVIPAYISTDGDGGDEREFLQPFFPDTATLCKAIFLKGYQWPFDVHKIGSYGSSLIDVLVYRERFLLGRKVFLDYRRNPSPIEGSDPFSLETLPEEALEYLRRSNAMETTPIERLNKMNPQAVELYETHNIDLWNEPLEIAVCAQHNNGGLSVDIWWESVNIKRLFPVGEVAGTHGVSRPGGSALNSGQVGAARAAQKIAGLYKGYELENEDFSPVAKETCSKMLAIIERGLGKDPMDRTAIPMGAYREQFRKRMSLCGAVIRSVVTTANGELEAAGQVEDFARIRVENRYLIPKFLQTRHLAITHHAYLSSIAAYLRFGGGSRGSYLVLEDGGQSIHHLLETLWQFKPEDSAFKEDVMASRLEGGEYVHQLLQKRPVPQDEFWFETVWRDFLQGKHLQIGSNRLKKSDSVGI